MPRRSLFAIAGRPLARILVLNDPNRAFEACVVTADPLPPLPAYILAARERERIRRQAIWDAAEGGPVQ